MKNIRCPDQQQLFDPFAGVISRTGWKQIEQGWQGLLRHILLKKLPARKLGADLSDEMGRPSAELYSMCGLLLVREFHAWTVPETHEAVLFRSDVQYALNLRPGFEISQRTIERYIRRLYQDESLAAEIFLVLTDHLVSALEISVKKQRLDSTHVLSDMAVFGRARMMGVAIKRFLNAVRKHQAEAFQHVPETLQKRYLKDSDASVFGDARTCELRRVARDQAAADLHQVIELFAADPTICDWQRYKQLVTIFNQQCEFVEDRIELKEKAGGHVLQNPSDGDATYCGKKGPGYQVQLTETCDSDNEVNLIVSAQVETAAQSDADAVAPVLEDLAVRDLLPEELLADAGYGGDKNVELAKSNDVEMTSPVPGGAKYDPDKIGVDKFTIETNDAGEPQVIACPASHTPNESRYNASSDRVVVTMDYELCSSCPLAALCPVKLKRGQKKNSAKVHFEMREHRAGQRREVEQTDAFRIAYRARSGIEGLNSCLKRRLGLGRLRVRGRPAVQSVLFLKLAGWNLLRASTVRKLRAIVEEAMRNLEDIGVMGDIFGAYTTSKTARKSQRGPVIALAC